MAEYSRIEKAQFERPFLTKRMERAHVNAPALHDLDESLRNMEVHETLVEGMVQEQTVIVAAGQSNSGKTTILQQLCVSVGLGLTFGVPRCMQGRVIWIAGEDARNAELRFNAIADANGLDREELKKWLLTMPKAIAVMDDESMDAVHQAIAQRWGLNARVSLFVLDSKSTLWGGTEENSNDETAHFVKSLREHFCARYGAAVILTHHLNKNPDNPTPRGASALTNNIDESWAFERGNDAASVVSFTAGKTRMIRWPKMMAEITSYTLHGERYEHLRDTLGLMPTVSLARPVDVCGVSLRSMRKDANTDRLLKLIVDDPSARKSDLAKLMGSTRKDTGYGDSAGIERLFTKLLTDKLIRVSKAASARSGYEATPAGIERVRHLDQEAAFGEPEGDQ